jgi:hypothetical protein
MVSQSLGQDDPGGTLPDETIAGSATFEVIRNCVDPNKQKVEFSCPLVFTAAEKTACGGGPCTNPFLGEGCESNGAATKKAQYIPKNPGAKSSVRPPAVSIGIQVKLRAPEPYVICYEKVICKCLKEGNYPAECTSGQTIEHRMNIYEEINKPCQVAGNP